MVASIKPVSFADVDTIAQVGLERFCTDRHSQIKELGGISYTQENGLRELISENLKSENYVFIKAVDEKGQTLGSASFVFVGFSDADIPRSDPGKEPEKPKAQETFANPIKTHEKIIKMEEMEAKDLENWQNTFMPPGTKCIIVADLNVNKEQQFQGVGSTLLKWGTDLADKHGVFMWAHSGEGKFPAFLEAGFTVSGTLSINLDEWAPEPPKDEGDGSIWGHYLVRYMKRLPKSG
jgi:hypothetical protein